MDFPEGLKYTHEHEWIRDEGGDIYTVGITEHAAEQLGDVTYVELPEPGMVLDQGQAAGAVESVKAASDIYAPISGHVSEVNQELDRRPELVNASPYNDGWFFKIAEGNLREYDKLMDCKEYARFVEDQGV
ncbi:MAG TPA: glycine cleavage system protein GcvH [Candidatus Hydrogenedentes bacterium]|jgi:glycine cleavage system H protein|nr:glycine cleavage system protein GcvH [Candidatus Hydrogenedentota bacterium]HPK00077.1 glycine cleavage system protein GcvH [Candidatus Hydrogenedentota bacterium]